MLSEFEGTDAFTAPSFVDRLVGEATSKPAQWGLDKKAELILESEAADFFSLLDAGPSTSRKNLYAFFRSYESTKKDERNEHGRSPLVPVSDNAAIAFFAVRPTLSRYENTEHLGAALLIVGGIVVASYSFGFIGDMTRAAWPTVRRDDRKASEGQFFRRIFASYSRKDIEIVKLVDSVVRSLGVGDLLWDLKILRAGEEWEERIREEINQADQFQLFWSANSKRSSQVTAEWKYALSLGRSGFVRPVYWKRTLPKPPSELSHLHFEYIGDPRRFL